MEKVYFNADTIQGNILMLKEYLKKIFKTSNRQDAREESYYSILKDMLLAYSDSVGRKNDYITVLPKKTDAGNPDFRIWDGNQHIVGYIEAKAPTVENLDQIEESEQLKRYRDTFPNLILTNFLEFRLYRNGEIIDKVSIARPFVLYTLETIPPAEKTNDFLKLLEKFFSFSLPVVYDAETLASELAKRTRFLKDEVVIQELKNENNTIETGVWGFYEAFKQFLIGYLSKEEFADLYSQTITYGLFAARTRSENGFTKKSAYDSIPKTIGILRDIFKYVLLEDLPKQMEWIIDDIIEILAITNVKSILHKYYVEGKGSDPIIFFYETFLTKYDPETREKRGVYYTPESVVSYIVSSLHIILKDKFNKPDGFANKDVTVLDPAAGTLTFLAETTKTAVSETIAKYGEGIKEIFIREHILKNFYAFELMMAPYAVGHLKMSFILEEIGYKLEPNERVKLYLTNALDIEELAQTILPGLSSLSEESHIATKIKKEQPILVILGNPPYSGHSANASERTIAIRTKNGNETKKKIKTWIGGLIEDYKTVDGKPLDEKNPKWLQDDYVKFIRFAQWKIDQAGKGVLGFITNHSYLDNPTFRGMRQSLMKSFNEIYILNLHGNTKKKEKCPDGSKDENVFDIQQGVAIAIYIKKRINITRKEKRTVRFSEIWGLQENKTNWLLHHNIKKTRWLKITPKPPFYFFVPVDYDLLPQYIKFPSINEIFPIKSVGIATARDNLTIRWSKDEVWNTIRRFTSLDVETARQTYKLGKDVRDWKVELAQKDVIDSGLDKNKIVPILYRPFDVRYTYYTGNSRGFHCMPRPEVMKHMFYDNIGMCIGRAGQVVGVDKLWNIVFCSNHITDLNLFYRGGNVLYPLYLYKKKNPPKKRLSPPIMMVFEPSSEYVAKEPNISKNILENLTKYFKKLPSPEEILNYIYAILYSSMYRTEFSEFLKTDFPRIPFTKNYNLFTKLAQLGQRLVNLHLINSQELDTPLAKCYGEGEKTIKKVQYENGKVYINNNYYFEPVLEEIWNYHIGGYQVCHKWLKDRKGRRLFLEEIEQYCKIVTSISKTIEIQKEIDAIFPKILNSLIEF